MTQPDFLKDDLYEQALSEFPVPSLTCHPDKFVPLVTAWGAKHAKALATAMEAREVKPC